MRGLFVCVALAWVSPAVGADCVAQSARARPHLIELFSSEGCSSCPPAETWLRTLRNGSDTVALEFHVDYWDSLGWRDRFADPRYTARQQALAAHSGRGMVYTPEVVLDGREWRDWYRHAAMSQVAGSAATMKLAVEPGAPLRVRIDTTLANPADTPAYHNFVVLTEDGLSSQVRAGENRGATLRHDHVVRALLGPLPLDGSVEMNVPADVDLAHAALVAFAQRAPDDAIAQVVMLPLEACRK